MNGSRTACTIVLVAMAVSAAVVASGQQAPAPATRPTGKPPALASGDREFIQTVAKGGMAEVALGELAGARAANADVKQFGLRMVQDHGKANEELAQLARDKRVEPPKEVDRTQKSVHDRLAKLSGDAFDRAYVQEMLKDHQKDVADFRTESKSGKDADVKAWASKTLPTLEEHLKMVQDLSKGAVGTSGTKKPTGK